MSTLFEVVASEMGWGMKDGWRRYEEVVVLARWRKGLCWLELERVGREGRGTRD